jgi:vacuolar-type H+-ATPase subunit H
MDEIVKLYEEKISTKTSTGDQIKNKIPIDANKVILDTLAELNDRQLKILVYINQAILNFII